MVKFSNLKEKGENLCSYGNKIERVYKKMAEFGNQINI